jgi:hypothetical protein
MMYRKRAIIVFLLIFAPVFGAADSKARVAAALTGSGTGATPLLPKSGGNASALRGYTAAPAHQTMDNSAENDKGCCSDCCYNYCFCCSTRWCDERDPHSGKKRCECNLNDCFD